MPTLTRWFLRAAMVHLVAGLALSLLLSLPGTGLEPGAWRASYIHLLVLGWASQMIFGVAYWMFPRREPLDVRAVPWLGWTCFAALNAGVALRLVVEPAIGSGAPGVAAGAVVAALLQLLSVVAFVLMAWPRVASR